MKINFIIAAAIMFIISTAKSEAKDCFVSVIVTCDLQDASASSSRTQMNHETFLAKVSDTVGGNTTGYCEYVWPEEVGTRALDFMNNENDIDGILEMKRKWCKNSKFTKHSVSISDNFEQEKIRTDENYYTCRKYPRVYACGGDDRTLKNPINLDKYRGI